jgi:hypothetical protein
MRFNDSSPAPAEMLWRVKKGWLRRVFYPGEWLPVLVAFAAGAALRLWFIQHHPPIQGDSLFYGDIAKNWLAHGVYGRTIQGNYGPMVEPTLARLPGYPAFVALCFAIFGLDHYGAILYMQGALDLLTCLLIARFVLRVCGRPAAMIALLLAALCPFTANYVAVPLTETTSVFCVALGFYSLAEFLARRQTLWLVPMTFAWSYAALLRPDGALLGIVLFFALAFSSPAEGSTNSRKFLAERRTIGLALLCAFFALVPFAAWTVRNLHAFRVVQVLVGRDAADSGETVTAGFDRWMKTWAIDFTATSDIDWNADNDTLDIRLLPSRAFDTPAQYQATRRLFADYNSITTLTPLIDARFAAIAAERIRSHPIPYYLTLPLLRVADMWLRPRMEMLDIPLRWWQFRRHPAATCFALLYGALNLAYLAAALVGIFRWPRAAPGLLWAMLAYILLRCLVLATVEGPETRYTLECFPLVIALASVSFIVPSRQSAASGTNNCVLGTGD